MYSAFTSAFAAVCCGVLHLELPGWCESGPSERARTFREACEGYVASRCSLHSRTMMEIDSHESEANVEALGQCCDKAISLNPVFPDVFLARAWARLRSGIRWQCIDDVHVYLWLS